MRLRLVNALSPLVDGGYIEGVLVNQFEPLFDPAFREMLSRPYPNGVQFVVNGRVLNGHTWERGERAPVTVKLRRKRKPSAVGFLVRANQPVPEDRQGVAISTYGKVIKRGWDWLGLTPADPELVGGLIEAPALAESLTLNKADVIRVGAHAGPYHAYRGDKSGYPSASPPRGGHGRAGLRTRTRSRRRPADRSPD